ncbi:MAG: acyl-CoA dehydratase activase [Dehalococcoidales bacterium]|nr:acyl-CoA dehydratase activase [Dehalococcoidales bacterium]MDD4230244.1 acyl-CoA dehydratase activase [Dehalococcoidales bacterium]MDD5402227.1 acyl-CoA dehydratase activase [Dehalococcoidales bacterium]
MSTAETFFYMGVDIGSVSTKLVILDDKKRVVAGCCLPTAGNPANALRKGLLRVQSDIQPSDELAGVAVTGSGRKLAGELIGADIIKNEITCQAVSALHTDRNVQTVIEIGGQDSKLIVVREGLVVDFGMNTVCAAGTGSFLDHQASRLGVSLDEMSQLADKSQKPVTINATCTVFAESDMITHQQTGSSLEDIVYGLCKALVANYRRSVIQSRPTAEPVVFQGGVAYNRGIQRAFQEELGIDLQIPNRPELTGAAGAALICMSEKSPGKSGFKGFNCLL